MKKNITDLLGQVFIFGFGGKSLSSDFKKLLKKNKLGGVILFERNIESKNQIKELCSELKSLSEVPAFIMIDQEGGEKNRITKDFPIFPSNLFLGEKEDKEGLFLAYKTTAKNLKQLGINVNLAPVVDVLTNPKNEVIGERSFGPDPNRVASFSKIAIEATHSERVLACAKHFPGIGDIDKDPHQDLPVNNNPQKRFEKTDFLPFREAISSGAELIMTSHVFCPNLDSENLSTFSKRICTDILKKKLGFEGLVLTDDMGMGAVKRNCDLNHPCYKAFLAGHDLILSCHEFEGHNALLEYFERLLVDKKIDEKFFSETVKKIIIKKKNRLAASCN